MRKIIALRGLPASGKSTYAKKLVKENPGMYKRINRDDLREMLDGYNLTKSNEKFAKKTRDWLIRQAILDGKHVIVDDTNLSDRNIRRFEQLATELAKETGTEIKVETKMFDITLDEALKRDAARERPVGNRVIKKLHGQFFGKKEVLKYRDQDEHLPKAIICDLDGTLAIIGDRSPFDGAKCEIDLPNAPVVNMVKNYRSLGYKILLLSGRDGQYEAETKRWLEKNNVNYDALWMRKPKDNRKDAIIKRELFENHIENKYYVECILDDRNQVVDLWRNELNLPCFQVYYGDF